MLSCICKFRWTCVRERRVNWQPQVTPSLTHPSLLQYASCQSLPSDTLYTKYSYIIKINIINQFHKWKYNLQKIIFK